MKLVRTRRDRLREWAVGVCVIGGSGVLYLLLFAAIRWLAGWW